MHLYAGQRAVWVAHHFHQLANGASCGALSSNWYNANKSCVMHIYRHHACCEHSTATGQQKHQMPYKTRKKSATYQQALEKNQKRRSNSTRERELTTQRPQKVDHHMLSVCENFSLCCYSCFFFLSYAVPFVIADGAHAFQPPTRQHCTIQLCDAHPTTRSRFSFYLCPFVVYVHVYFLPFFFRVYWLPIKSWSVCFFLSRVIRWMLDLTLSILLACIHCTHFPISVFAFPDKCSHRTGKVILIK